MKWARFNYWFCVFMAGWDLANVLRGAYVIWNGFLFLVMFACMMWWSKRLKELRAT